MLGIIIQARIGSKRLPGKMTIPFVGDKGIFETILVRLIDSEITSPIVVATTTNAEDDILIKISNKYGINYYRGSENNVLDRFIKCGYKFGFDKIIRICADNPFIDLNFLVNQINCFEKSNSDYWCYSLDNLSPTILGHAGFWTEGVKLSALEQIKKFTNENSHLEHVTKFIYENRNIFNIHFEKLDANQLGLNGIRLTVDSLNDFLLAKEIFTSTDTLDFFSMQDIVDYVRSRNDLLRIMSDQILLNKK